MLTIKECQSYLETSGKHYSELKIKKIREFLYALGEIEYELFQENLFFEKATTAVKKKILGSIFTGKLIFENGNYRTTGLNAAIALISQFQQEFGHKKAEHLAIPNNTFGNVPIAGQL